MSASSTTAAAWRTAYSASGSSMCTAATEVTGIDPVTRTAASSRSGRATAASVSAATTTRRAQAGCSPVSSIANSRSEARAASRIATYSSSSASPTEYDSRSDGVSANAVPPNGSRTPSATRRRNIGSVAGT
jgi:hypothetical protein